MTKNSSQISIGKKAKAFAPASTGNVAVGFDLLGFAIDVAGDTATVEIIPESKVIIESNSSISTPLDPRKNTAGLGLVHLIEDLNLKYGFKVTIEKGIPLGSGMGGSAASSAAVITATNQLLEQPLNQNQLLSYALIGESVASQSFHADNIAPSLLGGLTFAEVQLNKSHNSEKTHNTEVRAKDLKVDVIQIPLPKSLFVSLIHPHLVVETKTARGILQPTITLKNHVKQSASLIKLLSGCYTNNINWIRNSLEDHLIEPQRAHLIPGFSEAKKIALTKGAFGFSISGAGPSVFAWSENRNTAEEIRKAVVEVFKTFNIDCDSWTSSICERGAHCIT